MKINTTLGFSFDCDVLTVSLWLDLNSMLKQPFHKVCSAHFAGEVLALLLLDGILAHGLINMAHNGCHQKHKKG